LQRKQQAVEDLELDLEASEPNDGRIKSLEQSLQEAQNDKTLEEGQYEDSVIEKDKLDTEARSCKTDLEFIGKEQSELNMRIGKAAAKKQKLKEKREDALKAKNDAIEQVKIHEDNKTEWERARGEQQVTVDDLIAEAQQIPPHERVQVPQGHSYDDLQNKLQRMIRQREESERELGGSQDELLDKATAAKDAHKRAKDGLHEMERVTDVSGACGRTLEATNASTDA
jgi:structural maintenance of chromosomes protein 6